MNSTQIRIASYSLSQWNLHTSSSLFTIESPMHAPKKSNIWIRFLSAAQKDESASQAQLLQNIENEHITSQLAAERNNLTNN